MRVTGRHDLLHRHRRRRESIRRTLLLRAPTPRPHRWQSLPRLRRPSTTTQPLRSRTGRCRRPSCATISRTRCRRSRTSRRDAGKSRRAARAPRRRRWRRRRRRRFGNHPGVARPSAADDTVPRRPSASPKTGAERTFELLSFDTIDERPAAEESYDLLDKILGKGVANKADAFYLPYLQTGHVFMLLVLLLACSVTYLGSRSRRSRPITASYCSRGSPSPSSSTPGVRGTRAAWPPRSVRASGSGWSSASCSAVWRLASSSTPCQTPRRRPRPAAEGPVALLLAAIRHTATSRISNAETESMNLSWVCLSSYHRSSDVLIRMRVAAAPSCAAGPGNRKHVNPCFCLHFCSFSARERLSEAQVNQKLNRDTVRTCTLHDGSLASCVHRPRRCPYPAGWRKAHSHYT